MCDDDRKDLERLIARVSENLDEGQKEQLLNSVKDDEAVSSVSEALLERLRPILERADKLGERDPDFDMKAYLDEMWGDI